MDRFLLVFCFDGLPVGCRSLATVGVVFFLWNIIFIYILQYNMSVVNRILVDSRFRQPDSRSTTDFRVELPETITVEDGMSCVVTDVRILATCLAPELARFLRQRYAMAVLVGFSFLESRRTLSRGEGFFRLPCIFRICRPR